MKKILKTILSKYDTFWTPVIIAALGLVAYGLRFFDNFVREYVPHLTAIAVALFVIAMVLFVLGVTVNWTNTDYRAHDASIQDVDETKDTPKK